jgi:putative pyruvate formate lyase activating enzyme
MRPRKSDLAPYPSYLPLHASRELKRRAERARAMLSPCRLCPRLCGADRTGGAIGTCGIGPSAVVASAGLHFGEEAHISGARGSGALFLAGCSLRCSFCQNASISRYVEGRATPPEALAALFLDLQEQGAHNLNWVTPTHCVPPLLEALALAVEAGMRLPIVFNSSGYDALETLRLLDGVVDIYMPDAKFADPACAERLAGAPDYPEVNRAALLEMARQTGPWTADGRGVARRGVLVRHLVLPGGASGTQAMMEFLGRELPEAALSLLSQYRPHHRAMTLDGMDRPIHRGEWEAAVEAARVLGPSIQYIQPFCGAE